MNADGHLNFSIYSVTLLGAGFGVRQFRTFTLMEFAEFSLGVYIGMRLPDIDIKSSRIGKYSPIPWLHKKLKKFKWYKGMWKHGGITHTIFVNIWIFILAYIYESLLGAGIAFGFATHIYIDDVTGNKLDMLYWPAIIKRGNKK